MRKLSLLLLLATPAWSDELLDKSRSYYKGLKTYQARITCTVFANPDNALEPDTSKRRAETVTRITAGLPKRLRLDAETTLAAEGGKWSETHIFDGTWQWISYRNPEGTSPIKLALKRWTTPARPFDTGVWIAAGKPENAGATSGLGMQGELAGSIRQLLSQKNIARTNERLSLGKIPCQVYVVGGDRREVIYLDDQGLVRGYQKVHWPLEQYVPMLAQVRLDEFKALTTVPSAPFVVSNPKKYIDGGEEISMPGEGGARELESENRNFVACVEHNDVINAAYFVRRRPALLKKGNVLHWASGHFEMVEWLVQQGLDPTALNEESMSPVHCSRQLREWQLFAQKGVDFKALQARSRPLMFTAFRAGSPEMVSYLQSLGIGGPVATDSDTVLHIAAAGEHPEIMVPLALAMGVPVDARTSRGETPMVALLDNQAEGQAAALKAMVAKGLQVDAPLEDGSTVLMAAVDSGSRQAVQSLLSAGANPNRLMRVAYQLPDQGDKPEPPGESSAMHLASVAGDPQLLDMLLGAKGNPNLVGELGWTPLHCAAYWGRETQLRSLIKAGADPKVADQYGNSPLHVASSEGNTNLCQLLIQAGALPQALNKEGKTAAQVAKP